MPLQKEIKWKRLKLVLSRLKTYAQNKTFIRKPLAMKQAA
jgi:hypothetical protein